MNSRVISSLALVAALSCLSASPGAEAQAVEDFVIEGEVLKPEITVLISRENLNKKYDIVFEESFLQRIIDSVEHDPF